MRRCSSQARNQGGRSPLEILSLEKCIGHRLKLLNIVQKIWATLRKLSAPPQGPDMGKCRPPNHGLKQSQDFQDGIIS